MAIVKFKKKNHFNKRPLSFWRVNVPNQPPRLPSILIPCSFHRSNNCVSKHQSLEKNCLVRWITPNLGYSQHLAKNWFQCHRQSQRLWILWLQDINHLNSFTLNLPRKILCGRLHPNIRPLCRFACTTKSMPILFWWASLCIIEVQVCLAVFR